MLSQVPIALAMLLVSLATASESRHPFLLDLGWDVDQPAEDRMADFLQQTDLGVPMDKRDWSIPTDGLPPSQVEYWLLQNASSWPILANAGVRRMQTWCVLCLHTVSIPGADLWAQVSARDLDLRRAELVAVPRAAPLCVLLAGDGSSVDLIGDLQRTWTSIEPWETKQTVRTRVGSNRRDERVRGASFTAWLTPCTDFQRT